MSLLRLARGDAVAARSSIETALRDTSLDRLARARFLASYVEITLVGGDDGAARAAVAELEETAEVYGMPALGAAASHARGELELATGNADEAAARLQSAYRLWQTVEAPYEAARSRAGLADAHLKQGDLESASLELNAAIAMFERLGALPDLERCRSRSSELMAS
jgi:tetratricopeptide (TPR) repeat protein